MSNLISSLIKWFYILIARLRALVRRESILRDIEDELRTHVEMGTETNIECGMRPDDTRDAARKSFGDFGRIGNLALEFAEEDGWIHFGKTCATDSVSH